MAIEFQGATPNDGDLARQLTTLQASPALALTASQVAATQALVSGALKNSLAVVMGDSVTSNGLAGHGTRSIFGHVNRQLGLPYRVLTEVGYSGYTTAQIFANWASVVTPTAAGTVFFESGINNFSNGQTAAEAFAEIKAVWTCCALVEGRRLVYYMTGLLLGAQAGRERARYLSMCRQFARQNSSFEFIDCCTPLLDFNQTMAAAGDGVPLTGPNVLFDGVHPTGYGAMLSANAIVQHMQRKGYPDTPIFTPFPNNGQSGGGDLSNLVVNGTIGTNNTASFWTPWFGTSNNATARAPAFSVIANPGATALQKNLPGRLAQCVWTPGAGVAATDLMRILAAYDSGSAIGWWTAYGGKTFVARCYAKITSTGGNIQQAALHPYIYDGSYSPRIDTSDNYEEDYTTPAAHGLNVNSYEGYFETAPFVLPALADQGVHATWSFDIYADTGATVTAQIGAYEVMEIFSL